MGIDSLKYGSYAVLRDDGLHICDGSVLSSWAWSQDKKQLELSQEAALARPRGQHPSLDGQRVVLYDEHGLSVMDAVTGEVLWKDPKAYVKDSRLLEPAPGRGERVVLTPSGRFLRWNELTGEKLPSVRPPQGWKISHYWARTLSGADWVLVSRERGRWNSVQALMEFPSGRPIAYTTSTLGRGYRDDSPLLLDKDHFGFAAYFSNPSAVIWDIRANRPMGPLSTPEALSGHVFHLSSTSPSGLHAEIWCSPHNTEAAANAQCAPIIVEARTDGRGAKSSRILERTSISIAQLQFSPDEHHLLGWGKDGVAIWDVSSGARVFERPAVDRWQKHFCIDPSGTHLAMSRAETMLLVNLATAKTRRVRVAPEADRQLCLLDGVIRARHVGEGGKEDRRGVYEATRWDWQGNAHLFPRRFRDGEAPLDWETYAWSQPPQSALGRNIDSAGRLCQGETCRIPRTFDSQQPYAGLALVLDGKALIGFSYIGAYILTPDTERTLGFIAHAGTDAWVYVDTADFANVNQILRFTREGRAIGNRQVEILEGSDRDNLRCARGDRLYPWSECKSRFASPGALARRLKSLW